MKKIALSIIIVTIFSFVFSNFTYADNILSDNSAIQYSENSFNTLTDEGKVEIDGNESNLSTTTSSTSAIIGVIVSFMFSGVIIFPTAISLLTLQGGVKRTNGENSSYKSGWFSVCGLVYDEYAMFDVDVFRTTEEIAPDGFKPTNVSNAIDDLKGATMGFFKIMRIVAIALFIVLLIFTSIRLGLANIAADRARYKEAIKAWATGIIIMLLLEVFFVSLDVVIDKVMDALYDMRVNMESNGYSNFETSQFKGCLEAVKNSSGLLCAAYFIEFLAFTIVQVLFFGKYLYRSLKIFALIILSPIAVVYDLFDRIKGNASGVFGEWLKQYVMNIIIQPTDAIVYTIFMFTLSEVAMKAPLLSVAFLLALFRAEKILKAILKIDTGKIKTIFSRKNSVA